MQDEISATVRAVASARRHAFSKETRLAIELIAGEGFVGDAHRGVTVKHRSRARFNPTLPNLRQVHLLHEELFVELVAQGFDIRPGELGENVTTTGVDLLSLPTGTRLRLGPQALVELTGLRNPCIQIERFRAGLLDAVLLRDAQGGVIRKTGVMAIVLEGGTITPGDAITVELPPLPHRPLEKV